MHGGASTRYQTTPAGLPCSATRHSTSMLAQLVVLSTFFPKCYPEASVSTLYFILLKCASACITVSARGGRRGCGVDLAPRSIHYSSVSRFSIDSLKFSADNAGRLAAVMQAENCALRAGVWRCLGRPVVLQGVRWQRRRRWQERCGKARAGGSEKTPNTTAGTPRFFAHYDMPLCPRSSP